MSEATIETVANDAMNATPEKVKVAKALVDFEGTQYFIEKDAVNDLDVMENLAEIQSDPENNSAMMILVIRKIVGREQWNKFKESQRTETGRVTGDNLEAFINKIFKAVGAEK